MAWAAAIPAAAQIGSSLISAFTGGYDSHDNHRGKKQRSAVQSLVADAKKAGISPLVALGSPISSGYGAPAGSGTYDPGVNIDTSSLADMYSQLYGNDQDAKQRELDRAQNAQQFDREQARLAAQDKAANDIARQANTATELDNRYKQAMIDEVTSRTQLNRAQALSVGAAPHITGSAGTDTLVGPLGERYVNSPMNSYSDFANRYGMILGEGYGISKWISDNWMDTKPSSNNGYTIHLSPSTQSVPDPIAGGPM